MSDMNYGIGVEIQNGLKALKKFEDAAKKFDSGRIKALNIQLGLLNKIKKAQEDLGKVPVDYPKMPQPKSPNNDQKPPVKSMIGQPDVPKTTQSYFKKQIKEREKLHQAALRENDRRDKEALKAKEALVKKEQKEYEAVQKALTKRLATEEKERTRQVLAEAKVRVKARQDESKVQSGRRVQAVAQITKPSGASDMKKYYQNLEKVEARRAAQLKQAKAEIMSSTFMLKKQVTESEKLLQMDIRAAVAEAKEGKALRNKVRLLKNSTAELRKQHFLMSRMNSSAKEFAGNYVSAFAAAAVGGNIMQTGQDFERAENTLTALFQSSEKANQEMQYLKDLTYEMGIPLRETAKDYSKLLASVGEGLPIEESKLLFENLSKASVVMGTSAEDTSGILKALSQMLAKQKIQAEEYRGQLGLFGIKFCGSIKTPLIAGISCKPHVYGLI